MRYRNFTSSRVPDVDEDKGDIFDDFGLGVCNDSTACNYNQMGDCYWAMQGYNCDGTPIVGHGQEDANISCGIPEACNYQQLGNCYYPDTGYDCDGNAINPHGNEPQTSCGMLDACNYQEVGDCWFPETGYDCDGELIAVIPTAFGCTDESAFNYNPYALDDNGSCECGLPDACNYQEVGDCVFAPAGYDCNGMEIAVPPLDETDLTVAEEEVVDVVVEEEVADVLVEEEVADVVVEEEAVVEPVEPATTPPQPFKLSPVALVGIGVLAAIILMKK